MRSELKQLREELRLARDPAGALLRGVGLDVPVKNPVQFYVHRMHKESAIPKLYVGRERTLPYAGALSPDGGPQHLRWNDVPQRLQAAWSESYRLKSTASVGASEGSETALVSEMRRRLGGRAEVTGGLYACRPTAAVTSALLVAQWHDDGKCLNCGGDHAAATCNRDSQLPLEMSAKAAVAMAKMADAKTEQAREALRLAAPAAELAAAVQQLAPAPAPAPAAAPEEVAQVVAAAVAQVVPKPPAPGPELPTKGQWAVYGQARVPEATLLEIATKNRHAKVTEAKGEPYIAVHTFAVAVGAAGPLSVETKKRKRSESGEIEEVEFKKSPKQRQADLARVWAKEVWTKDRQAAIDEGRVQEDDVRQVPVL